MSPRRVPLTLAMLLAFLPGVQALATGDTGLPPRDPARWTLRVEPSVWFVAPTGDLRLPGSAATGNGEKLDLGDINLDSPRLSPYGELHFRRDAWRITLSGFSFSSDDRGSIADGPGQFGPLSFGAGDALTASLDYATFAAVGGYEFLNGERGERSDGGWKFRSRLIGFAGARFHMLDTGFAVEPAGGAVTRTSADGLFAHPIAGIRWELEIHEHITVDVIGAGGAFAWGDNAAWSADIVTGFTWRPVENLGVQLGYRQLLVGLRDGAAPERLEWRGGVAGLYAGLVLRF